MSTSSSNNSDGDWESDVSSVYISSEDHEESPQITTEIDLTTEDSNSVYISSEDNEQSPQITTEIDLTTEDSNSDDQFVEHMDTSNEISSSCFGIKRDDLKLYPVEWSGKSHEAEFQLKVGRNNSKRRSSINRESKQFKGSISHLDEKHDLVHIKPIGVHYSKKVYQFKLSSIKNSTQSDTVLKMGSPVIYCLSLKRNASGIPYVESVEVNETNDDSTMITSDDDHCRQQQSTQQRWYKGVIADKNFDYSYSIKVSRHQSLPAELSNVDISLPKLVVPKYGLPLRPGDIVEVLLGTRHHELPTAMACQIVQYYKRSLKRLVNYFDSIRPEYGKEFVILDIFSQKNLWTYLVSIIFNSNRLNAFYVIKLMQFFIELFHGIPPGSSRNYCNTVVKLIITSKLLNVDDDSTLLTFINNYRLNQCIDTSTDEQQQQFKFLNIGDILTNFFEIALQLDKSLVDSIYPFLIRISDSEISRRIQTFLLKIIGCALTTRPFVVTNNVLVSSSDWRDLSLIPNCEEMASTPLEYDPNLRPIKLVSEAYQNEEEYMDIYYRLLRADCFSSIQKGIKDYRCDQLDPRDMNVYFNVSLIGYDITNSGFALVLNYSSSNRTNSHSNVKFGSLMCLSPGGKFDRDYIWASVADCEPKQKRENQTNQKRHERIIVRLCTESNSLTDYDVLLTLWMNGGQCVMAESPTYFHSFGPVLQSLRRFNFNDFPLCRELMKCSHSETHPNPKYLSKQNNTYVHASVVFKDFDDFITLADLFEKLASRPSVFDSSQANAVIYALSNRLAVIQGPPGCGKTYVGAKLAEIILSCRPGIKKPILVLTYKNHCLDEFLKHTLKFLTLDEIVRVGGRSQEECLDECNLNYLERKGNKSRDAMAIKRQIKEKTLEIHLEAKKFYSCFQITPETILKDLTEEQLVGLLEGINLETINSFNQLFNNATTSLVSRRETRRSVLCDLQTNITNKFGSLKDFLLLDDSQFKVLSDETKFKAILIIIIEKWWPDVEKLKSFKEDLLAFSNVEKKNSAVDATTLREVRYDYEDDALMESVDEYRLEASEKFKEFKYRKAETNLRLWSKLKSKFLIEYKDLPPGITGNGHILNENNLWSFNEMSKIQFLGCLMKTKIDQRIPQFQGLLNQLETLQSAKEYIQVNRKLGILASKKIVGLTIVGASINSSLIEKLSPEVVIVEEAAEILEPKLLSALSPGIKHLIMIGDHKQLRPGVETYRLCREYKFNTSMMERLILGGYSYKSLKTQSRMRPEFANLLKDIYPSLLNHNENIRNNQPPLCMQKSMFFWCQAHPENKERSCSNVGEVTLIKNLTLFLIRWGCEAKDITVLGAYQGQTRLLKGEIHQHAECKDVIVNTIDMYQGDENKYVIVSLVRSNGRYNIGFLADLNRRCVAQSRAKCGLYFVGDYATFSHNIHWKRLIESMRALDCVGSKLGVQCDNHPDKSRKQVKDANDLRGILNNPNVLCKLKCGKEMPCKIKEHECKKLCKPTHSHSKCLEIVEFVFTNCGHEGKRQCYQDEIDMMCRRGITVRLTCGHFQDKECWQKDSDIPCSSMCTLKMNCGIHQCRNVCGLPHKHLACDSLVDCHLFPICQHRANHQRKCNEVLTLLCCDKVKVRADCGHEIEKICSDNSAQCFEVCLEERSCGHICTASHFCYQDCESRFCESCPDYSVRKEMAHSTIEADIEDMNKRICVNSSFDVIANHGETATEFQRIASVVMTMLRAGTNWYPIITKITNIDNRRLQRDFEDCKLLSSNFHDDIMLFPIDDQTNWEIIAHNGFQLPNKIGANGRGIVFPAKTLEFSNHLYTKGIKHILVCKVLLGRSLIVDNPDKKLNLSNLRKRKYDSVFVRASSSRPDFNNFVIYDTKQVCPQYVIEVEYKEVDAVCPMPTEEWTRTNQAMTLLSSSDVDYQIAQSILWHRLSFIGIYPPQYRLNTIEIIHNPFALMKFHTKRAEFVNANRLNDKIIIGFLGAEFTSDIDVIIHADQNLLNIRSDDVYFTELPHRNPLNFNYNRLLICLLVLGGDQHKQIADSPGIIKVNSWDQILPIFVIQ